MSPEHHQRAVEILLGNKREQVKMAGNAVTPNRPRHHRRLRRIPRIQDRVPTRRMSTSISSQRPQANRGN